MKTSQTGSAKLLIILIIVLFIGAGSLAYARHNGYIDLFVSPEAKAERELQELRTLFPDKIENYSLYGGSMHKVEVRSDCEKVEDHNDTKSFGIVGEVCTKYVTAEYHQDDGDNGIFVHASWTTSGKDVYDQLMNKISTPDTLNGQPIFRVENNELGWSPDKQFDVIITQEGKYLFRKDGGMEYRYPSKATGNNPVTQYFINAFPPKTIEAR